jgi:hypothetical protein
MKDENLLIGGKVRTMIIAATMEPLRIPVNRGQFAKVEMQRWRASA